MKKKLNICFLIIWMIVIFLLSNQNSTKSQSLSDGLIVKSVDVVATVTHKEITETRRLQIINNSSDIVRTSAHFIEYLILGVLVINVLKDYHKLNYKIVLMGIVMCIMYSMTDEIHQLFISGRSLQIKDILVDTLGSSIGALIFFKIRQKTNK